MLLFDTFRIRLASTHFSVRSEYLVVVVDSKSQSGMKAGRRSYYLTVKAVSTLPGAGTRTRLAVGESAAAPDD